MADLRPPRGVESTPHRVIGTVPGQASASVVRAAAAATRAAATAPPQHPAVYAPWTALLASAEKRYKTEVSAALADLTRATNDAGHILDQAAAYAAEAAGQLERAAWDAWSRYMAAADDTRNNILGQAATHYDQAITYATGQYDRAMTDAEKTYQAITADATRAQGDVKAISA